jgi:hypothetical protein
VDHQLLDHPVVFDPRRELNSLLSWPGNRDILKFFTQNTTIIVYCYPRKSQIVSQKSAKTAEIKTWIPAFIQTDSLLTKEHENYNDNNNSFFFNSSALQARP